MDYTAAVNEKIHMDLVKAGFSVGGENGADKVIVKVLVDEMAKLNARLDKLEK